MQKNTCVHTYTHLFTCRYLWDPWGNSQGPLPIRCRRLGLVHSTPFSCFLCIIYQEALLILPLYISRVYLLLFLYISSTLNQTSVMIWLTHATGGPYYCMLHCWISPYCTCHCTNCFPYNWLMTFSWVCKCLWTGAMFADLLFLPVVTMQINKYTGFQHTLKKAMKETVNEAFL